MSPVDRGEALRCLARSAGRAQCTLDAGHEVERSHEWCGMPFEAVDFDGRAMRSLRRSDTTNGSAPAEGADAEGERGSGPAVGARSAPNGGDEEWFDLMARALKASVKNTAAAKADGERFMVALAKATDALCAAQEKAAQDAAALDFAKCIERERDELSAAGRIARAALQSAYDAFGYFTYEGSVPLLALQNVREALGVLDEALDTAPATEGPPTRCKNCGKGIDPVTHQCEACGLDHTEPCHVCGGWGLHNDGCSEMAPSSGEREPIQPEPVPGEVLT